RFEVGGCAIGDAVPFRSGSFEDHKAPTTTPLGQILKTASSGEGPSPFRSLPNVMRARAFADERGLAMGGGRPTERRFTVGGSGKSVARCHRMVLAYWKFESISLQRRGDAARAVGRPSLGDRRPERDLRQRPRLR